MLYIPLGPPASGKSTLALRMALKGLISPDAIVSPDEIRLTLTGDISDQTANKQVFELCDRIMSIRLQRDLDVFVDATNLTNFTESMNMARAYEQLGVLILMPSLTPQELFDRCQNRGRPIPMEVLIRMSQQYVNILRTLDDSVPHIYPTELL